MSSAIDKPEDATPYRLRLMAKVARGTGKEHFAVAFECAATRISELAKRVSKLVDEKT